MQSANTIIISICIALTASQNLFAEVVNVPNDFETIQAAISGEGTEDGDTVLVAPGNYSENIDFHSKDIVVGSLFLTTGDTTYIDSTIIDGGSFGTVVTFENGETRDACINGFTITNGASEGNGGGIRCSNSSPTIRFCKIIDNYARTRGGGLSCEPDAHPRIEYCRIEHNRVGSGGGGIWVGQSSNPEILSCIIDDNEATWNGGGVNMFDNCRPVIRNCSIRGNTANSSGGGIMVSLDCQPSIENCLISGNFANDRGGGIMVERGAFPFIRHCVMAGNMTEGFDGWHIAMVDNSDAFMLNSNITWAPIFGWTPAIYLLASDFIAVNSIIYGDSPLTITVDNAASVTVSHCDIAGGRRSISADDSAQVRWLDGNIAASPQFIDYNNGDYHLSEGSPCIDAGTAFFIWEDDTLVNLSPADYHGNAPDMGAFESDYSAIPISPSTPPLSFTISPAYPNPFNSAFRLNYQLPAALKVSIVLIDNTGRELRTLDRGFMSAGEYRLVWDAAGLPAGCYFLRLKAGGLSRVQKVVLEK